MAKQQDDTYNDEEAARLRDEALRRMLNTKPQPHKKSAEGEKSAQKQKGKADK